MAVIFRSVEVEFKTGESSDVELVCVLEVSLLLVETESNSFGSFEV